MPVTKWLAGARVHDLRATRGNGPFGASQLGVVLHVNESEAGTPAWFWGADQSRNPDSVCPNFQVFADGSVDQMLPFDWQPWCQADGNYRYAAIETAGLASEPLTAAQIHSCAAIMAVYARERGVPLDLADTPGDRGLGIHAMGGAAWGGHSCPGTIRAGQRPRILAAARMMMGAEMDAETAAEVRAIAREVTTNAIEAILSGEDHGYFTNARFPHAVQGKDRGVLDRLAALEHPAGGQ